MEKNLLLQMDKESSYLQYYGRDPPVSSFLCHGSVTDICADLGKLAIVVAA